MKANKTNDLTAIESIDLDQRDMRALTECLTGLKNHARAAGDRRGPLDEILRELLRPPERTIEVTTTYPSEYMVEGGENRIFESMTGNYA